MKYNEALERARKELKEYVHKDCDDTTRRTAITIISSLFPELKESEGERMKKAITHILYENYTDAAVIEGVEIAEIVTWLEEQCANKEYVFRPIAGTMIETAIEQALKQGDVVLAFNGFYTPVKGKTSDEILTEYYHWLFELREQKQTWKPSAAQLIVIKELIEDKNTSKVNKVILRGMFDEFKQFTNSNTETNKL